MSQVSSEAGDALERRGFLQVSLPPRFCVLRVSALALLCCSFVTAGGVSAAGWRPEAGESLVTLTGVVEAYGSEPHLVFMIRAMDGRLYYPLGDLQRELSLLRGAEYEWTGVLLPPRPSLPGIIPAHDGSFSSLTWRP